MKKLWGGIGTGLFWLLWPVFVFYFRLSGSRARALVICDDEILLVQSWLSNKKWSLPGGGTKKDESLVTAAVRELYEETGIETAESSLTKLGTFKHTKYHFDYLGHLYVLNLAEKPELKLQRKEIRAAKWIPIEDSKQYRLNDETRSALRRYRPPEQASLL